MAKIIAWLVLVVVVLFALRVINARKARSRNAAAAASAGEIASQPMVRCARCGVFLPRNDALPVAGGYACADRECAKR
jgi:uncharacterized protein